MRNDLRWWITLCEKQNIVESRPDMETAESILAHAGYEVVGDGGAYGIVYAKFGDPYVLKLFSSKDQAYPAFVEYAMDNQGPHIPRFKGRMMRITAEYSAIRIERLAPLPGVKELGWDIEAYMLAMTNGPPIGKDSEEAINRLKQHPSLFDAVEHLTANLILGMGFLPDTDSDENIMGRNGIPVLVDPICGRATKTAI